MSLTNEGHHVISSRLSASGAFSFDSFNFRSSFWKQLNWECSQSEDMETMCGVVQVTSRECMEWHVTARLSQSVLRSISTGVEHSLSMYWPRSLNCFSKVSWFLSEIRLNFSSWKMKKKEWRQPGGQKRAWIKHKPRRSYKDGIFTTRRRTSPRHCLDCSKESIMINQSSVTINQIDNFINVPDRSSFHIRKLIGDT